MIVRVESVASTEPRELRASVLLNMLARDGRCCAEEEGADEHAKGDEEEEQCSQAHAMLS
jgi:hypothetical protein